MRHGQQSGGGPGWMGRPACAIGAIAILSVALRLRDSAGSRWAAVLLAIALSALLANWALRDRRLARLTARAQRLLALHEPTPIVGHTIDRLDRAIDGLADLLGTLEQRVTQRHPVSGLPTREPLFAAIDADLARLPGGVLGLISLVDFERLTAFDPAAADAMLIAVVDRARRMLGEQRMLAQVDRFRLAIWFGAGAEPEAARAQLDALGYALGTPIRTGTREWLPEIRVTATPVPREGTTAHMLLSRAIGTATLGDTIAAEPIADPIADPIATARERYAMEQDLRRAIERNEFDLRFQPLVDADARRVCGAEALLRWTHPVHGPVPPSRFVPIVEAAGLADEVGLWVLNAACREARAWQRQGLGALRVAVNISGHQLARVDLSALIARTLARHSLAADALEIELTETVAASDAGRTAALFRHLRAMGVAIAIDDFGTGYSSFSALRQLCFDKLKIDREFVTAVDQRRDSQAICRSMIALGQGLGIRVLAEGVERREEYDWLRRNGCAHFQGYYFAPPLDSVMFPAFVQDGDQLATRIGAPRLSRPERLSA